VARVLAALLIGTLAGLTGQVLLLALAVFVVAAAYEFLRARGAAALPARLVRAEGAAERGWNKVVFQVQMIRGLPVSSMSTTAVSWVAPDW
jgi:hypothetical protein